MKIYLAAPYSLKELVTERAAELRALGIEVTSTWITEPHAPTTQMSELTHEQHLQYALQDVEDVAKADLLLFHVDETKQLVRGGRHVEFGIVVGINRFVRKMPIFVVGADHENIFHHLPYVVHFATWEDARKAVGTLTRREKLLDEEGTREVIKSQGF